MSLFDFFKLKNTVGRGYLSIYDQQTVADKWQQVEELLGGNSAEAKRRAVIEADKVLDYVLDRLFPNQASTGERLKLAKEIFVGRIQEYDELWFAHKARNEMVHNLNFEMPTAEVNATLEKFKEGLKILGGLRP
ncbi:MAG: hypothetical protein A3F35_02570 [Candidatus Woykebacteria bacterium RIFCSPHIGHO2_12_FULL_45_10]|uniref:Uncharacterized protein n=1 Tax=Candidatus Woykebacteria bacterium RIFCSPHIGHO2_12_FULL_45_10 TaxID=1802603 RepID=A0A1G1WQ88_9BACT|nr:MAG: hypothetical protein A3F35_02570 [Candidatus Woykebacteria bacterium RIFCSPHIGHO2_12_FULL_45_10]